MALGADGRSVLRLLVGRGLVPVAVGLVLGLAGSAAVSHVVRSLLFEVDPIDPIAFAGVPLLLLLVAAASIAAPALRATRLDPAQTLRPRA
jgi:putative ABC transport system permease protein